MNGLLLSNETLESRSEKLVMSFIPSVTQAACCVVAPALSEHLSITTNVFEIIKIGSHLLRTPKNNLTKFWNQILNYGCDVCGNRP